MHLVFVGVSLYLLYKSACLLSLPISYNHHVLSQAAHPSHLIPNHEDEASAEGDGDHGERPGEQQEPPLHPRPLVPPWYLG